MIPKYGYKILYSSDEGHRGSHMMRGREGKGDLREGSVVVAVAVGGSSSSVSSPLPFPRHARTTNIPTIIRPVCAPYME
jgi:hypothetical protein